MVLFKNNMKTTGKLIAAAMASALLAASCKNNRNTAQSQEPALEEIQAQKQAIADSVLAKIDALYDSFSSYTEQSMDLQKIILTDQEKLVKPDYLLDPSVVAGLVTKSQKINALAILYADLPVRIIYGMEIDGTKQAIGKLVAELGFPIGAKGPGETSASEMIRNDYNEFKRKGDLSSFWQFQHTRLVEVNYILANSANLFMDKIPEPELQAFRNSWMTIRSAIGELAKYDEEMALINDLHNNMAINSLPQESDATTVSPEAQKNAYMNNLNILVSMRNALLE